MKIAVVGAGFCGLAVCWHLLQTERCHVTLIDSKGIGGGASGASTGLLHPYPGEHARGSWNAHEGIAATRRLLHVAEDSLQRSVANYEGIIRLAWNEKQLQSFSEKFSSNQDVQQIEENTFLIKSGITVNASFYMQGLWRACESKGAHLQIAKVASLDDLKQYDHVILTMGAGIVALKESASLRLQLIKGQALTCLRPPRLASLEKSLIAQAYFAMGKRPEWVQVGATYERQFTSDEPCLQTAFSKLKEKMAPFFPDITEQSVIDCTAGVRVMNRDHYIPLLKKLSPNCWALTAMGSRGLLYHAYFAELLVKELFEVRTEE